MTVVVENLTRRFGDTAALQGVSLSLRPGEFAALLGPSGSGKTTLLRILAGLDFPDAGAVRIAGQDVAQVPARLRGVGVVFQHYALFRHMSVFDNVAFGLRVRPRRTRPEEAEIARRVRRLLELVQIPELSARYPDQISGGQRQRVALARALAIEPQLLLLDEPFGALDALVRKEVRRWVRGLHEQLGITSVLVTHDQEEAMEMADRIAVMERGRIVQFDAPERLLDQPATPFVAGFVGEGTRIPARIAGGRLDTPPFGDVGQVDLPEGEAEVYLRPQDLRVVSGAAASVTGRVELARRLHHGLWRVRLNLAGQVLEGTAASGLDRGDTCGVHLLGLTAFAQGGRRVSLRLEEATRPLSVVAPQRAQGD